MCSERRTWKRRSGTWGLGMASLLLIGAAASWAQPPPAGGGDRLIQLSFRDAPLDQILQFYAELTGRTMIKSPGITGTITIKSQTRLTEEESLQALDAILHMNNVALVPLGEKFFKVVQPTAVRQEGFPISRVPRDEPFPETDKLVSQVVVIRHLEVSEVQPIIQGMIHGYGNVQALEQANSLLITDTAVNIQRIMEVLELIDQPVALQVEMQIYQIRFADATEIAGKLQELIAETQGEQPEGQQPRVPQPTVPPRPGIIRPRQPTPAQQQAAQQQAAQQQAAALAQRGIIRGDVKIIADERTNIIFIFSRPENFVFFDDIIRVLDVPTEAEIIVRVEPLEFAEAAEIAGILNEFIGAAAAEGGAGVAPPPEGAEGEAEAPRAQALRDFVLQRAQQRLQDTVAEAGADIGRLDPNTRILPDERTNSLLLMGRKADIIAIQNMIDQLDIMLAQVLIETVIMEIDLRDDLAYGIDWLQRSFTVFNEEQPGPGGGVPVREPVFSFGGGQRVLGSETEFIDAAEVARDTPVASALTYYTTFEDLNIDTIIQMAAGSSDARILQTPVVLTTDNTEAQIIVGEERPIITTTSTTDAGTIRSQFEYRNIGINLTVTPRINPERFVAMQINQTADDVGGTVLIDGNEVPIITKREFSASIGVVSRETIVLGGLVRTDKRKSRTKVPLLGDVPVLGSLFRSDTHNDVRTELMVLITPYVLMTEGEAVAETKRLYESTVLPESRWERGWSDSPLSDLPLARRKSTRWSRKHPGRAQEERAPEEEIIELDNGETSSTWDLPVPAGEGLADEEAEALIQEYLQPVAEEGTNGPPSTSDSETESPAMNTPLGG